LYQDYRFQKGFFFDLDTSLSIAKIIIPQKSAEDNTFADFCSQGRPVGEYSSPPSCDLDNIFIRNRPQGLPFSFTLS
jgi:hypothetical protein